MPEEQTGELRRSKPEAKIFKRRCRLSHNWRWCCRNSNQDQGKVHKGSFYQKTKHDDELQMAKDC